MAELPSPASVYTLASYTNAPSNTASAAPAPDHTVRMTLGLDPVGRRAADREVREQLQRAERKAEQLRGLVTRWQGYANEMAGQRDDYQRLLAGCKQSLDTARAHAENWRSMYAHALDRAAGTCTPIGPFRICTVVSARDLTTTVSVTITAFGRVKQLFQATI